MNIFDATTKLKRYCYKDNKQLVKFGKNIELSGSTPFTMLTSLDLITSIKDYKKTVDRHELNFLFDNDFYHTVSRVKSDIKISEERLLRSSPAFVDTKEYWNFLHENFQFCDVCSYYNVNDIKSYFNVKGQHYNAIIAAVGIDFFKDKKILEIGPGYGYLPLILDKMKIKHDYYCADIVQRFSYDNFIDLNGYTLSNITDKFDIVIMQDVIQHLGKDILSTYTTQIKNKLLKDGGSLIIGTELRTSQDYISIFFAQSYYNFGVINLEKHMTEGLGFKQTRLPLIMVNQIIGTVYKYDNIQEISGS